MKKLTPYMTAIALSLNFFGGAWAQTVNTNQSAVREHINSGNGFLSRLSFDKAIEEYEEAVKLDPSNQTAKRNIAVAHNNWGIFLARHKKYDEALEQFNKVLELDPNFADAKRNISLVKQDMAKENPEAANPVWEPEKEEAKHKGTKKDTTGAPKEKQEQPSAVILTPGLKSGTGTSESQPADTGSAGGTATYGPGLFGQPGAQSTSSQTAPSAIPAGGTIEDQLSAIEQKVYGHKQSDMPVFKRIEKLETDTAGATRTGTIKERIEYLRQNYGL